MQQLQQQQLWERHFFLVFPICALPLLVFDEFFEPRIKSLVGVEELMMTSCTRQLSCNSTFAEPRMAEEVAISRRERERTTVESTLYCGQRSHELTTS